MGSGILQRGLFEFEEIAPLGGNTRIIASGASQPLYVVPSVVTTYTFSASEAGDYLMTGIISCIIDATPPPTKWEASSKFTAQMRKNGLASGITSHGLLSNIMSQSPTGTTNTYPIYGTATFAAGDTFSLLLTNHDSADSVTAGVSDLRFLKDPAGLP